LLSDFVGWYINYKNMYGMSNTHIKIYCEKKSERQKETHVEKIRVNKSVYGEFYD